MVASRRQREELGLPPRPFFYTLDQIAGLLGIQEDYLRRAYIHFAGRTTGQPSLDKILAANMAPPGEDGVSVDKPDWRVSEDEYIRWLRRKGFYVTEKVIRHHLRKER